MLISLKAVSDTSLEGEKILLYKKNNLKQTFFNLNTDDTFANYIIILMLILLLGFYTIWLWAVLSMFWQYMLPSGFTLFLCLINHHATEMYINHKNFTASLSLQE
jgi:hypothetical protein